MIEDFWGGSGAGAAMAREAPDAGFILVDADLDAIAMDDGAASILAAIRGTRSPYTSTRSPSLPAPLRERIRRVRPGTERTPIVFVSGQSAYTARVHAMQSPEQASGGVWLLLALERDAGIAEAIARGSKQYGLTEREAEILSLLACGLTSKEVAHRLGISPSTLKSFLRVTTVRVGARNRVDMLARLLEPHDEEDDRDAATSTLAMLE